MATYTALMKLMVESAKQKDTIEKLKTSLKQKSKELKNVRNELQRHKNIQNTKCKTKEIVNVESDHNDQEVNMSVS